MTTIRLLDARRGLNRKCEELFGNARIAEAIYRFLCDGIEECEDAEPERKKGKWDIFFSDHYKVHEIGVECSRCGYRTQERTNYCPNCGAEMTGGDSSCTT